MWAAAYSPKYHLWETNRGPQTKKKELKFRFLNFVNDKLCILRIK